MKIPNPIGRTPDEYRREVEREIRALVETNHRLSELLRDRDRTIADLRVRVAALVAEGPRR